MSILRAIEVLMPVAAVIAAVLLRRIAAAETPDAAPAGQNQPECTRCGATEINWVARDYRT